jgi:hypothetical protein
MVEKKDGLPRSDGDQSREEGDKSRNDAVRRGASRGPQGRNCCEIFWSTEQAAQGPLSGCGAPPETEGKHPGKSSIPEEIDRCRQEDGSLCRSDMAQEKRRQEKLEQGLG